MKQENLPDGRRTLAEVLKEFQSWHSVRKRGSRVPQRLWQAAAELLELHSISDISHTLGLDYTRLKQRVEALPPSLLERRSFDEYGRSNVASGFVELGVAPGGSTGECSVEAEDGKGKKLKMHLKGDGCAKVVEIAKAFWERRR